MTRELKNWAFEQPIRYGGANLNGVTTGERGCEQILLHESGMVCVRWSNGDEMFVVGRAWGVGKSAALQELAKAAEVVASAMGDAVAGKPNVLEEIAERGPFEGETEAQIAIRTAVTKPKRDKDGRRISE